MRTRDLQAADELVKDECEGSVWETKMYNCRGMRLFGKSDSRLNRGGEALGKLQREPGVEEWKGTARK